MIEAAFAEAEAAPLSAKKALLVALLIDREVDRIFAAHASASEDLLSFRAGIAASAPALAEIMTLAALRPDGSRLAIDAVKVPLADYGALSTADFMVSLYNDNTVQRVLLTHPHGPRTEIHPLLKAAITELRGINARSRVPFSP